MARVYRGGEEGGILTSKDPPMARVYRGGGGGGSTNLEGSSDGSCVGVLLPVLQNTLRPPHGQVLFRNNLFLFFIINFVAKLFRLNILCCTHLYNSAFHSLFIAT